MVNSFKAYAQQYRCTLAEAIADRDWPADRATLVQWFQEAEGRAPTEDEIETMSPNSHAHINDEMRHWTEK